MYLAKLMLCSCGTTQGLPPRALLLLPGPGIRHDRSHRSCSGPGVEVAQRSEIPAGIARREATNLATGRRQLFVGTAHNKIPRLVQGRLCTALPHLTTGAGADYEVGPFVRTSRSCCSGLRLASKAHPDIGARHPRHLDSKSAEFEHQAAAQPYEASRG